jgi:hypothetical protein
VNPHLGTSCEHFYILRKHFQYSEGTPMPPLFQQIFLFSFRTAFFQLCSIQAITWTIAQSVNIFREPFIWSHHLFGIVHSVNNFVNITFKLVICTQRCFLHTNLAPPLATNSSTFLCPINYACVWGGGGRGVTRRKICRIKCLTYVLFPAGCPHPLHLSRL